jgi:hypothetical protein
MLPPTPHTTNSLHFVALPHAIWLLVGATLASSLPGAHAYSWNLRGDARQCANSTVVLNGSGGNPPYKLLMIPFGSTPLKVEARRIVEQTFITGDQTSGEINVGYPANSQFVAVVSSFISLPCVCPSRSPPPNFFFLVRCVVVVMRIRVH